MHTQKDRIKAQFAAILGCFALMAGGVKALAGDSGMLVSMSVPTNTQLMPRTIFTETWTIKNNGTTTWTATAANYTLNLISWDTLGAIQLYTNTVAKRFTPSAIIGSGKSIGPGTNATFSMEFIAPEAAGTYTDTFQLNNSSSQYFGPPFMVQITVKSAGSTNQYDRARAVSYANNYAGYICSDGYFWTNGSDFYDYGTNVPTPTNLIGDDCAHFVSCCIGSQPNMRGAGLNIPTRVSPTYGEPSAPRLATTCLIAPGYAVEVSSLSQMLPGDVVGWNWEGNTNMANLDHITLYLGNGLLAAHAASCLDVSANSWYQGSEPNYVRHLIHIYDAPTIGLAVTGGKMVLSWGTNWTGYTLQSSLSLATNALWSAVRITPTKIGAMNVVTNTMGTGNTAVFYRLMLP